MDTNIKERSCHRFLLNITVLILKWVFVVYANTVISYFTLNILGKNVMKSILNARAYVNLKRLQFNKRDRMPVGARFSAPVQTGPGAHPASCTTGTGSFPRVKRLGRGADYPPPSTPDVKERI